MLLQITTEKLSRLCLLMTRSVTLLPPATKLGQGNIFRGCVNNSVHRGVCVVAWGGAWLHQGGMHGFIPGVCMVLFWGACMVLFKGGRACFFQFFGIQ